MIHVRPSQIYLFSCISQQNPLFSQHTRTSAKCVHYLQYVDNVRLITKLPNQYRQNITQVVWRITVHQHLTNSFILDFSRFFLLPHINFQFSWFRTFYFDSFSLYNHHSVHRHSGHSIYCIKLGVVNRYNYINLTNINVTFSTLEFVLSNG